MELNESNKKQIIISLDTKVHKTFAINNGLIDENNLENNLEENILEKKMRVETKTWGLNEIDLEHNKQLNTINNIIEKKLMEKVEKKYATKILSHIKTKIQSYKQQDINKNRLNEEQFVSLESVLELLKECDLKCHYCSKEVYILYEIVREMSQWSLDRINNDIGHNQGNLLVACLECNLKRRRKNKDAFFFTKNLVITREGIDITR